MKAAHYLGFKALTAAQKLTFSEERFFKDKYSSRTNSVINQGQIP
jgi:hypothetical protein